MYFTDAATVKKVVPVTSRSWIGQTVKLTCKADGSPTPTLSWKNPSGRVIKEETKLQTTVDVPMKSDQDFGNYTCEATNDVNTDSSTVQVQQISKWNIFSLVVYRQMDLLRSNSIFRPKTISQVAIMKTKSAAIAFSLLLLSIPSLFLSLLSFSSVTVILELLGLKNPGF